MAFIDHVKLMFGADTSGITKGVKKAKNSVTGLGDAMSKFKTMAGGAFSLGAIAAFTKKTIDAGSKIFDQAQMMGTSTDQLQEFDYWLGQNNSSLEDLRVTFAAIARNRDAALKGNPSMIKDFLGLGVSQADLEKKSVAQIYTEAVIRIKELGLGVDEIKPKLLRTFGETAGKQIPAIVAGLRESNEELLKMGGLIDENTIRRSKRNSGRLSALWTRFKASAAPKVANVLETGELTYISGRAKAEEMALRAWNKRLGNPEDAGVAELYSNTRKRVQQVASPPRVQQLSFGGATSPATSEAMVLFRSMENELKKANTNAE